MLRFVYALHACLQSYSPNTTVFVDLFDCKNTIGKICYFSTAYEDWRPDAKEFPKEAIGKPLGDWKGERWVDYRNDKIRGILIRRLDKAKSKGCHGVDPDNIDGHTSKSGFSLTEKDQKHFISWLSAEAHKRGLKIGLKNSSETAKELSSLVDFHVAEECTKYKECARYPGDKTFFIEYMKRNDSVCKVRPYTLFSDVSLKSFEFCQ